MPSTPSTPVGFTTDQYPVDQTNDRDLLLTVASGEVMTAFEDELVFSRYVMSKTISTGDKAQFLATGELNAKRHKRGTELAGQPFRAAERFIRVDRPLVADFAVYDFDSMLAQHDLRPEMMKKAGYALAYQFNLETLATLGRAALVYTNRDTSGTGDAAGSAAPYVPLAVGTSEWSKSLLTYGRQPNILQPGGTVLGVDADNADRFTAAKNLYDAIVACAKVLTLKRVPEQGRYCVIPTELWYNYLWARNSDGDLFNFDANYMQFIPGQQQQNVLGTNIAGITVFPSNIFPDTTTAIGALEWPDDKYAMPWANIRGIVWHQSAVGDLIKLGATFEQERDVRRQEDFVVAKMLGGHDVLRPECAIMLYQATASATVSALTPYADQARSLFITDTSYAV